MATFYTDIASLGRLEVTGSAILSSSAGHVLKIQGSGSSIFSISGSKGPLFEISDTDNVGAIFTIESASIEVFKIGTDKDVNISGSLAVTGSFIVNTGNVGINTKTFDPISPQALLVSTNTINAISAEANINTYIQLNISNNSAGTAASSDIVATNDTGTESGNFVDLGINSSTYVGIVGAANDAYLYTTGSNLLIGNQTRGNSAIKLFSGNDATAFQLVLSGSNTLISSSLTLSGSFSASLAEGYAWVGGVGNVTKLVATSSFGGGGGGLVVTTQTAATYNETATSGDKLVLLDTTSNNILVNLPTAVGNTAIITLKKKGIPNSVTVDPNGTQTIDGHTQAVILRLNESITIMSDNSNWQIT